MNRGGFRGGGRGGGGGRGRGGGGGRGHARYGVAPGGRLKTSTTRLPGALQEQIDSQSASSSGGGLMNGIEDDRNFSKKFKNKAANRKLLRKQERAEKKSHRMPTLSKKQLSMKQQHIQSTTVPEGGGGKGSTTNKKQKTTHSQEINLDEDEDFGPTTTTTPSTPTSSTKKAKKSSTSSSSSSSSSKQPTSIDLSTMNAEKLAKLAISNPAFYAMLQEDGLIGANEDDEDEEDQYLRHYEKKLGIKRGDGSKLKSKKSFLEDGLGDLLEGIEVGSRRIDQVTGVAPAKKNGSLSSSVSSATAGVSSLKTATKSENSKKRKAVQEEQEDDDDDSEDGQDSEEGEDSFDEELEGLGSDEDGSDQGSFDEELEGFGNDSEEDDDDDEMSDEETEAMMMEGMEDGEEDDDNDGFGSMEETFTDPENDDDDDEEEEEKIKERTEGVESSATATTTTATIGAPTKYIPPQMRAAMAAAAAAEAAAAASKGGKDLTKGLTRNTEELARLRRALQGMLNKLSESNIESILMDIEGLYRKFPRADSFVILYATVVASLYRLVGIEFAAHFVQTLIERFDQHHDLASSTNSLEMTEETLSAVKQCTNLIVLVSELYNMQVIACVMVYELIRWFMKSLSELNVELVVKIVKTSGYQLRQDDPSALKTIIQEFNTLANSAKTGSTGTGTGGSTATAAVVMTSRTKYLLETLSALKANRMKGPSSNSTTSGTIDESTTRMKKFLSGLSKKRTTFPSEPIRVGLNDIRQVGTKGKWWLVGSSWKNNMVGEESQYSTNKKTTKDNKRTADDDVMEQEDELMKLARLNRMNTDIRKSIFVILMSSQDYLDAFERLTKLGLKEVQQREMVRVLLHCGGNEKVYNPYYTLVGQRLCQHDHSFKITFQYSLWDWLREMGATDVGGMEKVKDGKVVGLDDGFSDGKKIPLRKIVNLSRMYGFLISAGDLSLVMLKTVTFTSLPQQPTLFFQLMLTNIILASQAQALSVAAAAADGGDNDDDDMEEDEKSTKKKKNKKLAAVKSKFSAQALVDIFIKAAVNPTLAQGVIFFLQAFVRKGQVCQTEQEKEIVLWACGVVKDTLSAAVKTGGRF